MTDGADVDDNEASDATMEALFTLKVIAFHEAAHSVVRYRTLGAAGGRVTIVPRVDALGGAEDIFRDGPNPAHAESKLLTYYAGGHAQRTVDVRTAQWGCWHDDEQAVELLREFDWEAREQELRDRSLALTQHHWSEIVAVAEELLRVKELDATEVVILADAAAGSVAQDLPPEFTNLSAYRRFRQASLDQERQRQIVGYDED